MNTILITTSSFGKNDRGPLDFLEKAGFGFELNPFGRKLTTAEVDELIALHKPVGMIAGVEPLNESTLKKAPGLKVISRAGIGMDNVDQQAAEAVGIAVRNTPDAPTGAVAELTISLILSLLRQTHLSDASIRAGNWIRPMGNLLTGKTVGIIGCGRIGTYVATLLKAFSCNVIGLDPYLESSDVIEMVNEDQFYADSDIISLHLPFTADVKHIINADSIAKCKTGVFIINASRGGLVCEGDLAEELKSGKIAGAALDCFEQEPYTGPLAQFDNVILTAHIGSYAIEGRILMEMQAAENLVSALANLKES
jgi:D-3-phosphoglycerate dehydrogenase